MRTLTQSELHAIVKDVAELNKAVAPATRHTPSAFQVADSSG